jgi:hypothetical protein
MNKTTVFILFVLLISLSIYSQPQSIIIFQPKGSQYKKMEMGIKSGIKKTVSIRSVHSRNEAEIINAINAETPGLVIATGLENIRMLKRIQQKHPDINQTPSILIENELSDDKNDNSSNSCVISYQTQLKQYIDRFVYLTGKKPLNIGIVFSSRTSGGLVQSYHNEAAQLGVNIHSKPVIISDPENSLKSIIRNFIDHYKIDGLIILNDDAVINNQNISTIWVPLLSPLRIPVAVPADFFYELEPRIGSFAIQPHFSEIGRVIASVINDAEAGNWVLNHKSVYTDKAIFYFRNENGSISRQNLLQNKIVATYHQKKSTPIASEPVVVAEATQKPALPEPVKEEKEEEQVIPPSPSTEPVAAIKEVAKKEVKDKPVTTVASNVTNKKAETPPKTVVDNSRQKPKTQDTKTTSKKTEKSSKQPQLKDTTVEQQSVMHFVAANYDIIISADTTFVYKELSPDFPVLGVAKAGELIKVKSEDSLWYCVDFLGTSGFVLKTEAQRYSAESQTALSVSNQTVLVIGIFILTVILVLAIFLFRSKKQGVCGISCLLISKKQKMVKYSNINNNSISLAKYLINYGFQIINSKSLNQASAFLHLNIPEIICVDWKFDPDIQDKMNDMLRFKMLTENFFLIYYNVTSPSSVKKSDYFDDRTFFFGKNLTISDLNSVLSMIKMKPDTLHEDDGSKSCLEGKITEETLTEIFQMMDTNKKTGCLSVENHRPIGMIFFEEGIITFAVTDKLTAEEAVFELLSMKNGRFQFLPGKRPTTRQMHLDTLAVLMERAKLDDEVQTSFEPI